MRILKTNDKVLVKPYKINLYTNGGHFKRHQDSPDKGMLGTILISLHDKTYDNNGGVLKVERHGNKFPFGWSPCEPGNYIMFYTDCPHEVTPVEGDWYRATLSFKVYVENNIDEFKLDKYLENTYLKQIVENLNSIKKPFGLIMGHDYSLNTNSLKGQDALIYKALQEMNVKIILLPVCVHYSGHSDEDSDRINSININVFPMTNECIQYLSSETEIEPNILKDISDSNIGFYKLNEGYCWADNNQDFISHVGNECQPANIDSIYLHRAFIIY